MTDLEKLAQEWLERYWGFKMKPGVGKRDLLPLLERVRAAGRIEGLLEAARVARKHMAFNTSEPYHINPEAYHQICELAGIERHHPYHDGARIQELEDEK